VFDAAATVGIIFTAATGVDALFDRIAALVPPPRIQRHRCFDVLARTAAHGKFSRRQ